MSNRAPFLKHFPLEAVAWLTALIFLAVYAPSRDTHFTLCPLATRGLDFCPGCGLGRSISCLFHGQVMESFNAHPLGIFAVIVLTLRITRLINKHLTTYGSND